MKMVMRVASVLAGCVLAAWVSAQPPAVPQISTADGIERLVAALQTAIQAGHPAAVRALAGADIGDAALAEFTGIMTSPPVTAVTVKERDRAVMPGGRQRVLVEILTERDRAGVVSTWRLDVAPPAPGAAGDRPWRITQIEKLTILTGLYRLALDTATEYTVTNLVLQAPDLTLRLPAGRAFTANTEDGPTALVLLGRGTVEFAPRPDSERGQVHTFCGADALSTRFDSVLVRLNPSASRHANRAGRDDAAGGRPEGSAERDGRVRVAGAAQLPDRRGRSQPPALVARAWRDGHHRRNHHEEIRHADLRASRLGTRGHLVLRPPPQEEHRRLRVGGEARRAGTLLQRR